jgi:hypothetical protein
MELVELRALATLLRELGATHYKNGSLELTLGAAPQVGEEIHDDGVGEDPRDVVGDTPNPIPLSYRRLFEGGQ